MLENLSLGFWTWDVQSQKMARGLKHCTYWNQEEEGLYYLSSENKVFAIYQK